MGAGWADVVVSDLLFTALLVRHRETLACGDLFEFKTGLPLARNDVYGYFYGVGLE